MLATVPPTRSSFLSLRYSVYLVSNHRPSTLGYLKLKPRNEDGVIHEGVSCEQVIDRKVPQTEKVRAHALVYWRGVRVDAGESTPASTTRRRGGANREESAERVDQRWRAETVRHLKI